MGGTFEIKEGVVKTFLCVGKIKALTEGQMKVRQSLAKWTGDLIALGKFFRDHSVEKTLEVAIRRGAKDAVERHFHGLHWMLIKEDASKETNETSEPSPLAPPGPPPEGTTDPAHLVTSDPPDVPST